MQHWTEALPNRIVDKKMRLRTLEMEKRRLSHYDHVSGMSSLMESPTVKRLSKLKQSVLDETKNTQIERSNRILLEKITHIFSGKSQYNHDMRVRRLSENELKKKRQRIATENSQLNKRLNAVQSEYAFDKPKMPKSQSPNNHTPVKFRDSHNHKQYVVRARKRRGSNSHNHEIVFEPCNEKKHILYRGVKKFDGKDYDIEASLSNGRFVFRAEEKEGDLVKYMHMEEEDYRHLRKQYLPNGIISLFQYIRIGDVIEIQGLDNNHMRTSTIIELPSKEVQSKMVAHRYH